MRQAASRHKPRQSQNTGLENFQVALERGGRADNARLALFRHSKPTGIRMDGV